MLLETLADQADQETMVHEEKMVLRDLRETRETREPRANLVYRETLDCKEALVKRVHLDLKETVVSLDPKDLRVPKEMLDQQDPRVLLAQKEPKDPRELEEVMVKKEQLGQEDLPDHQDLPVFLLKELSRHQMIINSLLARENPEW